MADQIDSFLASGGNAPIVAAQPSAAPPTDPVDRFLASGGQSDLAPEPVSPDEVVRRVVANKATSMAAAIPAGFRSLYDLATGKSIAETDERYKQFIREHSYQPPDETSQALSKVYDTASASAANPLTWPTKAMDIVAENQFGPGSSLPEYLAQQAAKKRGQAFMSDRNPDIAPIFSGVLQGITSAAPLLRKGAGWQQKIEEPQPEVVQPQDVPMPEVKMTEGAAAETPPEAFQEPETVKPGEATVPAEQARRQRILGEIGLKDVQYRKSAVTGDPLEAATDYQLSKLNTEPGRFAQNLLTNERQAIGNYSQQTIENTGGRIGDTQTDTIARGQAVTDSLEKLANDFDTRTRSLYQAADARAQGVPTDLKGFQGTLEDDSLATNSDRINLRGALQSYLKKLKVVDENGDITASVKQAETIRKYLNENWSPQNSGLVGKLKDALDEDVTGAAGTDIYQAARAVRAERAQTLENPKGIAKLMDVEGPNRAIASDKVMQSLETMPPEQLQHVMDTLRAMGEDGQEAVSEIQSHFAQRAHQIGTSQEVQWNSKGYNQFLKNNSSRLNIVFADKPDILRRLYTTNEAGKILRFSPQYPGAAAQAINIGKAGTVPTYLHRGITMGASALGGVLTGGPWGATAGGAVGEVLGAKAARAAADKAAMKAAESRAVGPSP